MVALQAAISKVTAKMPPTISKSEVKGKYINLPLGVGNLASFSLNNFKTSFRIYKRDLKMAM